MFLSIAQNPHSDNVKIEADLGALYSKASSPKESLGPSSFLTSSFIMI